MYGLIDGDVAIHLACYFSQGGGVDEDDVAQTCSGIVDSWVRETGSEVPIVCLGDRPTFRHQLSPEYKGNRPSEKPEWYSFCRDWYETNFHSIVLPNLEADDTLGILATGRYLGRSIIITSDKDLLQIPGEYYNVRSQVRVSVTPEEGNYRRMVQWLSGDSTDNYKGIRGVGEKTATKLLGDTPTAERVWEIYEEKGYDLEYARLQGMLARILTHETWSETEGALPLEAPFELPTP
tara:strand:- start:4885 stop:5592 length:708 start_codon:yes stop_codon:yes gene_type:complete